MAENAVDSANNPERKHEIQKILLGLIPLAAIFLILMFVLLSFGELPPALWKTREITIAEVQEKAGHFNSGLGQRRSWVGSGGSGQETIYVIEDQEGRTYRVNGKELPVGIRTVLREGTDWTLVYSPRLGSRQVKGLIWDGNGTAYLDAEAKASDWYAHLPLYVIILLALLGSVWASVHHVRKGLQNLRIVEYQARVRAEQEKKSPGADLC